MHSSMCLISGAQRKPRFSQATLDKFAGSKTWALPEAARGARRRDGARLKGHGGTFSQQPVRSPQSAAVSLRSGYGNSGSLALFGQAAGIAAGVLCFLFFCHPQSRSDKELAGTPWATRVAEICSPSSRSLQLWARGPCENDARDQCGLSLVSSRGIRRYRSGSAGLAKSDGITALGLQTHGMPSAAQ